MNTDILLLDDFQNLHGASLHADAASDALRCGIFRLQHHDLQGANLHALAAADALLLVNHVHAGLGILGNGLSLAYLHALAALNASHGLGGISLRNDADTAQILVKFLVKRLGAGLNALQAGHALSILLNSKLFHGNTPLVFISDTIIHAK